MRLEGPYGIAILRFFKIIHLSKITDLHYSWAGFALDGIEFIYEDATSQLFGKRGGSPADFSLGM